VTIRPVKGAPGWQRFAWTMVAATIVGFATEAYASPGAIVTFQIENRNGDFERNVPVTFGVPFAKGDVPAGASIMARDGRGGTIPLQIDAKAHHGDGSLRHAIVTLDVPELRSGSNIPITIEQGASAPGAPVSLSALPTGFDVAVNLVVGGKRFTVSAQDLLNHTQPEVWLSGPLASEWWVSGPVRSADGVSDPHLSVRFGIRSYGRDRPLRIEVDVENTWTWIPHPMTELYDAQITMGAKEVFSQSGMVQAAQTRWRKVFWWNDIKVDTAADPNLPYLKKARVISNYSGMSAISGRGISGLYEHYKAVDHGPLSPGIITAYMPMTGGRADIGPLPLWSAYYLQTNDPRAAELTMVSADLSGSFPSHYRNHKTGYPTTTEEFPNISVHENYLGKPGSLEAPNTGGIKTKLSPDPAHEPSLDFIPYILTGERYYLEELEFWSQWNSWGTAPEYHGFGKSLVGWDQMRGQAWSLRTLAQAAYIAPDADPLKATLLAELSANIKWYDQQFTNNPEVNALHTVIRPTDITNGQISPWEDDFLTWAATYTVQLGFEDMRAFARWKAAFAVQRMINPDYCWILATPYHIYITNPDKSLVRNWGDALKNTFREYAKREWDPSQFQCGGSEMAQALGLNAAGAMMGGANRPDDSYPANMQPALAAAVDLGVPGADEAWAKFLARPVQPSGGFGTPWNIVPWPRP
jgi:hypothetical protein